MSDNWELPDVVLYPTCSGTSIAMTEEETAKNLSQVWKEKYWLICPKAAACMATLKPLSQHGKIKKND